MWGSAVILYADIDTMIYNACFAVEKTLYCVVPTDYVNLHGLTQDKTEEYEPYVVERFRYAKECTEWLKKNKCEDKMTRFSYKDLEPLPHALKILGQSIRDLQSATGAEQVFMYLTGDNNFRDKVATVKPYKITRTKRPKPIWYHQARQYAIDIFGVKLVHGREADDEVSIGQWSCIRNDQESIIATVDKDHKQVPGWHYDYEKKLWTRIKFSEAVRWFYIQLLAGDSTDDIPGIPGVAEKTAANLIAKAKAVTEDDMLDLALEQYALAKKNLIDEGEDHPYTRMSVEDIVTEMGRLVYMMRTPTDVWSLKTRFTQ